MNIVFAYSNVTHILRLQRYSGYSQMHFATIKLGTGLRSQYGKDTEGYGRIRKDTEGFGGIREDTEGYGRIGKHEFVNQTIRDFQRAFNGIVF